MNKRYKKSESRKGQPYNKSKRRRPQPSNQDSSSRERSRYSVEVLEVERSDGLDFDIKIPDVDWKIPEVPEIDMGELAKPLPDVTDIVVAPKTQAPTTSESDVIELPVFEAPAPKTRSRQPKVKTSKTTAPTSLGQQPTAKERAEQMKRDMLRRQQQQQKSRKGGEVDPGAIMAPIVMMVIALAFASSFNPPPIVYLIIMFFFGKNVWSIIQGQK